MGNAAGRAAICGRCLSPARARGYEDLRDYYQELQTTYIETIEQLRVQYEEDVASLIEARLQLAEASARVAALEEERERSSASLAEERQAWAAEKLAMRSEIEAHAAEVGEMAAAAKHAHERHQELHGPDEVASLIEARLCAAEATARAEELEEELASLSPPQKAR